MTPPPSPQIPRSVIPRSPIIIVTKVRGHHQSDLSDSDSDEPTSVHRELRSISPRAGGYMYRRNSFQRASASENTAVQIDDNGDDDRIEIDKSSASHSSSYLCEPTNCSRNSVATERSGCSGISYTCEYHKEIWLNVLIVAFSLCLLISIHILWLCGVFK